MIEYFNGLRNVYVNNLNTLTNLNQDELNLLATGRQEDFLNMLDGVNNELNAYNIEKIDVTPAWNWRPGTYDKFKNYMYNKLELHKRANGLDNLINRTKDKVNYMNYIQQRIARLETERYNLKDLGIKKDVNVEEWQEKVNTFIEEIQVKCDDVFEKTNGRVTISLFVGELSNRNPLLYYDIQLSNLELSVFSENTQIEKFPINDILIKYNTSLRHKVSGLRHDTSTYGISVQTDNNPMSLHPYISNRLNYTSNREHYGNVCLDKHNDSFHTAMRNNKLDVAAFTLLEWASYYSLTYANPYNQPYQCHVGAPKSMNDEYVATQSKSGILLHLDKSIKLMEKACDLNYYDKQCFVIDKYNEINCRFKEESPKYLIAVANKANMDSDDWCIYESAIGQILESFKDYCAADAYSKFSEITGTDFDYCMFSESGSYEYDELLKEMTDRLIRYMCNGQNPRKDSILCHYVASYLSEHGYFVKDDKVIKVSIDQNTEEMKSIMKQWANSSERV